MSCRIASLFAYLLVAAALLSTNPTIARSAELNGSEVANPKNNKENSTWQFWMELDTLQAYMRMHEYYKKPKQVPGGENTEGWVFSGTPTINRHGKWCHAWDWDPDFEGIWGNKVDGKVYAHPYTHHGMHAGMAFLYRVPAAGAYDISGGISDMQIVKQSKDGKAHTGKTADGRPITYRPGKIKEDGVIWIVDVVRDGKVHSGREIGRGGPIGDVNAKDSDTFKFDKVQLKKDDFVRLIIGPGKWWGTDMTRIDSFKIEPVK